MDKPSCGTVWQSVAESGPSRWHQVNFNRHQSHLFPNGLEGAAGKKHHNKKQSPRCVCISVIQYCNCLMDRFWPEADKTFNCNGRKNISFVDYLSQFGNGAVVERTPVLLTDVLHNLLMVMDMASR